MRDNVTRLLGEHGVPIPIPPPPPVPQLLNPAQRQFDAFGNAKYEQIACLGLKPPYDGSPSDLIPTLNLIHIRRQNETWYPATFITTQDGTQHDLVLQFSKIGNDVTLTRARSIWNDPNITVLRHTQGTDAYHACLFGIILTNSMSN
jgi:hypothetical protein